MEIELAIKKAEFLMVETDLALGGNALTEYRIYTWEGVEERGLDGLAARDPLVGLRVAEVSSWTPTSRGSRQGGGGSYMQMDVPWGAAVCRRVEELLLCYVEEWKDQPEHQYFGTWESEVSVIEAMFRQEGVSKYLLNRDSPYTD